MKVIILAAGYGGRMWPLTKNNHKTLIAINHDKMTIFDELVKSCIDNGITDIDVVTGYRDADMNAKMVELAQMYDDKVKFTVIHNTKYETTNNIVSLDMAFDTDIQDTILIESDLIMSEHVLHTLINSKFDNAALVSKYHSFMDGTVVDVDEPTQRIISVIPPHLQTESFDFSDKFKTMNVYKFSKSFIENDFKPLLKHYVHTHKSTGCYYELMLGLILYMQRQTIHAVEISADDWTEVDDPNDLELAKYKFATPKEQYEILQEKFGGLHNYQVIDFNFIRNMHFPTPGMLSEIKERLPNLLHNYGSKQTALNNKMRLAMKIDHGSLIALNGASQIYPLLLPILTQIDWVAESNVLIPQSTFGEYHRIFDDQNDFKTYHYNTGDYGALVTTLDDRHHDVCVIVNPNNPDGTRFTESEIARCIEANRETMFIIDESFVDFIADESASIINFLNDSGYDNVLVIKSLSKCLGVPGARLGYVYTQNVEFASALMSKLPIWGMNTIAEFIMEMLVKHRDTYNASIKKTIEDRDDFTESLQDVSRHTHTNGALEVYESHSQYVLCSIDSNVMLKRSASSDIPLEHFMMKHNIFIKNATDKFKHANVYDSNRQYYRIAVRTHHENVRFTNLLYQYLNS